MQSSNTSILYLEPILDPYQQVYLNVLTLSDIPKGPLATMTKQINTPKLSPFQTFSSAIMSAFPNCIYALTRYPTYTTDYWMVEDDLPFVFSYLQTNHYKIETELTEIMTKNNISQKRFSGNRKIICVFSYVPPI